MTHGLKEGIIVQLHDCQYIVTKAGNWIFFSNEGKKHEPYPVCVGGTDFWTHKKCYCADCKQRRKTLAEEINPGTWELINRLGQ